MSPELLAILKILIPLALGELAKDGVIDGVTGAAIRVWAETKTYHELGDFPDAPACATNEPNFNGGRD